MSEEEKKKAIIDLIEKTDLPEEAKKVGVAGAIMGQGSDAIINSMISTSNSAETKKAENEEIKAAPFAGYTPIEKKIAEMLTENTGVHMLDSGGAYGRHWQENRKVLDFRKRPAVMLDTYVAKETVLNAPKLTTRPVGVPALSNFIKEKAPSRLQKAPQVKASLTKKTTKKKKEEKVEIPEFDEEKRERLHA